MIASWCSSRRFAASASANAAIASTSSSLRAHGGQPTTRHSPAGSSGDTSQLHRADDPVHARADTPRPELDPLDCLRRSACSGRGSSARATTRRSAGTYPSCERHRRQVELSKKTICPQTSHEKGCIGRRYPSSNPANLRRSSVRGCSVGIRAARSSRSRDVDGSRGVTANFEPAPAAGLGFGGVDRERLVPEPARVHDVVGRAAERRRLQRSIDVEDAAARSCRSSGAAPTTAPTP